MTLVLISCARPIKAKAAEAIAERKSEAENRKRDGQRRCSCGSESSSTGKRLLEVFGCKWVVQGQRK